MLTPATCLGLLLDALVLPLAAVLWAVKVLLGVPLDRVIVHNTWLPPVLLVHGVWRERGGNSWDFLPAWLYLRGLYDVYTVQLDVDKHTSCEDLARVVADRIRAVRIQTGHSRVHVVGHSVGGLVAAAATMLVPDSVASLVTIGSPWQGVPASARSNGGGLFRDVVQGSAFLQQLAAVPGTVPMMCVCMLGDARVSWVRTLPSLDVTSHDGLILKNLGHQSAIVSPSTWNCIVSWLQCRALSTKARPIVEECE